MALLLNIDTATEIASVSITHNGTSISYLQNNQQKEHASFIHAATAEVLKVVGYSLKNIDAFAVTSGPGSYTGLRVGMATAKGFCYAFNRPLIAINTLEVMAKAAIEVLNELTDNVLLCPMIDARRMEVFTAIYNGHLESILPPQPMILEEGIFDYYMTNKKIVFFGSGSDKFREFATNPNATFKNVTYNAVHLGMLAEEAYNNKNFTDISYSEPTYFKEFHSTQKK